MGCYPAFLLYCGQNLRNAARCATEESLLKMTKNDFQIGIEFYTAVGKWRCTDIGVPTNRFQPTGAPPELVGTFRTPAAS